MSKSRSQTQSRKARREWLKSQRAIRIKNNMPFKEWAENVRSNIKDGQKRHSEHVETVKKNIEEEESERENQIAEELSQQGWSDSDIEKYLEIFRKNYWSRERKKKQNYEKHLDREFK